MSGCRDWLPEMKDEFLYHAVPNPMLGNILFPLNQLNEKNSDLFNSARSKYNWREGTLEVSVPKLNCRWGDVIHLSPIPPRTIYETLKSKRAGEYSNVEFFKIPASFIKLLRAIIYVPPPPPLIKETFSTQEQARGFVIGDDETQWLRDIESLAPYSKMPQSTANYYSFEAACGRRPLVYYGTPHVLVQDSIPIKECQRVNWRDMI